MFVSERTGFCVKIYSVKKSHAEAKSQKVWTIIMYEYHAKIDIRVTFHGSGKIREIEVSESVDDHHVYLAKNYFRVTFLG